MNNNKTTLSQNLKNWLIFHHMPGQQATFLPLNTLADALEHLHTDPLAVARRFQCSQVQCAYLSVREHRSVSLAAQWLQASPAHTILTRLDPRYPKQLNAISDPPAVLYVAGNVACLRYPQLAIVGTRKPSPSGLALARRFACDLVAQDMVVTSGLALGIDGAAHEAAVDARGCSIAVLGTGLQYIYPRRHQSLAKRLLERGAVVSELALDAQPRALHFPRRNRIISGLSLGVLVVEAAARSGSLISARLAGEQGREVFAIPGSLHNLQAKGCHRLLQQGAKLVEDVSDIMEELPAAVRFLKPKPRPKVVDKKGTTYNDSQLLHYFDDAPVSVDVLVGQTGWQVDRLLAELSALELAGCVRAVAGGYARCF